MGVPIAERILAAGRSLTVFNRTPGRTATLVELGARVAPGIAGLLAEAPVCITMLSDDAALEQVVAGRGGLLEDAPEGSILVDMSTVSPGASARVAAATDASGVRYLRAPVSGNPSVVRAGNLTIVVSGPGDALDDVRELLLAIGPNLYHVGEGEQARVVKLALQVLIGGTAELLAEAIVLGEAGGVDRATLLQVLGNSAVGSPFVRYKTEPLIAGNYSATFTTSMMLKDVGLVLAAAGDGGLSLPFVEGLKALLETTIAQGYGDSDFMALLLSREHPEAG
jgi:3-hydroxyisobutyrate dehydrogenase-like beta-hydroxyacid dehydrogenase